MQGKLWGEREQVKKMECMCSAVEGVVDYIRNHDISTWILESMDKLGEP